MKLDYEVHDQAVFVVIKQYDKNGDEISISNMNIPAKDRLPSDFEVMVMKRIKKNKMLAGNGNVAISAACRRLEKLGYAAKPGIHWYLTDKGDQYLDELKEEKSNAN